MEQGKTGMKNRGWMTADNADVHVHTPFSVCCSDITLEKLEEKARALNIIYAVTDHSSHMYLPRKLAWSLELDNFKDILAANRDHGKKTIESYLRKLEKSGAKKGIELDIYTDETLVFEDEYFKEFDIVIGAVQALVSLRKKEPPEKVIAEFKRLTLALLAGGKIDVLAHPFWCLLRRDVPFEADLPEWVVNNCLKYDVAIEINSHHRYPDMDLLMAKLALKKGVRLVKASDAHAMSEFGDYSYHHGILSRAHRNPD